MLLVAGCISRRDGGSPSTKSLSSKPTYHAPLISSGFENGKQARSDSRTGWVPNRLRQSRACLWTTLQSVGGPVSHAESAASASVSESNRILQRCSGASGKISTRTQNADAHACRHPRRAGMGGKLPCTRGLTTVGPYSREAKPIRQKRGRGQPNRRCDDNPHYSAQAPREAYPQQCDCPIDNRSYCPEQHGKELHRSNPSKT